MLSFWVPAVSDVVLHIKVSGGPAHSSTLNERGLDYVMRLFSVFINDSFRHLSAEVNDKLMKCTYLKGLMPVGN
jgi:hypothetical protein